MIWLQVAYWLHLVAFNATIETHAHIEFEGQSCKVAKLHYVQKIKILLLL